MKNEVHQRDDRVDPGPIAWMTRNRITPNLLMLIFLVGGVIVSAFSHQP